MNWQTKKLFEQARDAINDETVFSRKQIYVLRRIVDNIAEAVAKESTCISSHINHSNH